MQSHQLLKSHGRKHRRIGRGGKRGSFSGRGIKGQKARAGRRIKPQIRDIIKKIHKRRGYGRNRPQSVNPSTRKPAVVNLADLEKNFKDGDKITFKSLTEAGLIKITGRKMPRIKILGGGLPRLGKAGKLNKKLIFDKDILMSASAKKHVGKI